MKLKTKVKRNSRIKIIKTAKRQKSHKKAKRSSIKNNKTLEFGKSSKGKMEILSNEILKDQHKNECHR